MSVVSSILEKAWIRQVIYFFILLIICSVIWFPYHIYSKNLEILIENNLNQALATSIKNPQADLHDFNLNKLWSASAERFTLNGPVREVRDVNLRLNISSLLLLSLQLILEAEIYEAKIKADARSGIFSDPVKVSIDINELSLENIPQASQFFIRGEGNLASEFTVKGPRSASPSIQGGIFSLKLENGSYPGGHYVQVFKLPPLRGVNLELSGDFKYSALNQAEIKSAKLKLASDLFVIESEGSIAFSIDPARPKAKYNLQGKVNFLQNPEESADTKTLIGFLALASGSSQNSKIWTEQDWSFSLNGINSQSFPKYKVQPLGG